MSTDTVVMDAEILSEVIAPKEPDMAPDLARSLLDLRFSEGQNARMLELAAKNNAGTITAEERGMMESYRRVGNFLGLLQAKARLSLARGGQAGA